MKDFFYDLKYYCSSANTKSRGTYIMIAAILILLPIAAISGIVAEVVYIAASNFQLLPLIIVVVAIAFEVFLVAWLKKS